MIKSQECDDLASDPLQVVGCRAPLLLMTTAFGFPYPKTWLCSGTSQGGRSSPNHRGSCSPTSDNHGLRPPCSQELLDSLPHLPNSEGGRSSPDRRLLCSHRSDDRGLRPPSPQDPVALFDSLPHLPNSQSSSDAHDLKAADFHAWSAGFDRRCPSVPLLCFSPLLIISSSILFNIIHTSPLP